MQYELQGALYKMSLSHIAGYTDEMLLIPKAALHAKRLLTSLHHWAHTVFSTEQTNTKA